jgi:hypothetical protein
MNKLCIYCGQRAATDPDHIPPKCFFPTPRPSNLITVPSCRQCNNNFSKGDERVRNLITSLESTEDHPAIKNQLGDKRYRSLFRDRGITNLNHLINSLMTKDRYSDGGIYLEKAPAFNLDQPLMDRFFDRMSRALLYHENSIGYVNCRVEWHVSPNFSSIENIPNDIEKLLKCGKLRILGDNIFYYVGWFLPEKVNSLWILGFYDSVEFMTRLRVN